MSSTVALVRCADYSSHLVEQAVRQAISLLGGIEKFVKPNSKVLIKPNLLMAREPESGIDTHPEVVRAVVKVLKEINCQIYLGDGPSVWGTHGEDVDEVYEKSGMQRISQEEDIELVKFDKRRWRRKFPLTTWLDTCDYFLSIPKFKTHDLTILTGAIKNLYGLVSGTYKTELHKRYFSQEDFSRILVDIYEEAKPTLTIIDGIVAMEGDGPATSGKLRNTGLLLGGIDCVALDSILALIMGLRTYDILTNKEAAKRRLGVADISYVEILGERLEDVIKEPFELPTPSIKRKSIPRPIIEIAKNLILFFPKIENTNCTRCGVCIQACPYKTISLKANHISIDYSKCISCFCCQEVCPNAAISIKRSFIARLLKL